MLDAKDSVATVHLSFRPGVTLANRDGVLVLTHPRGEFVIGRVSPALSRALDRLVRGPEDGDALADSVLASDGTVADLARLLWLLDRLQALLVRHVVSMGQVMLSVTPMSLANPARAVPVPDAGLLVLSRFALCRRLAGQWVLESPLSAFRVTLHHQGAASMISALAQPCSAADLEQAASDLFRPAVRAVLAELAAGGFLSGAGDQPGDIGGEASAEDRDRVLRQWDFHDLLFHMRSRLGRHDYPFGATFRFTGEFPALSAIKPPPPGDGIDLSVPRRDATMRHDLTLLEAMETRASIRTYGQRPMSADQLGEFLYRTARVRGTYGPFPEQGMPYEASDRPYPTGGACYDLELYALVNRCDGVSPAAYHYDPAGHRLHMVADAAAGRPMFVMAALATGGAPPPDVLLIITSRFQRLSWKYQSIAYATTLKNVGVLYQTFYLVATTMGLAPCALGSGDSELAARVLGLDPTVESSVGDFMLGSRPEQVNAGRCGDWRLRFP